MSNIEVTLVDVSSWVRCRPESAENELLTQKLALRLVAARSLLSKGPVEREPETITHIQKFFRRQDRLLHLGSLLLKNRAFFQCYPELDGEYLVNLPRTVYKKPYIATRSETVEGQIDPYPISVSHQYPYVALARHASRIGLDIVMYDVYNPELYANLHEFLEAFRESLDPNEWQALQQQSYPLREFCVRWAVKEAYTKALGLGLGFDFASFETIFETSESLWDALAEHKGWLARRGEVVVKKKDVLLQQPRKEEWWFLFHRLPINLYAGEEADRGCMCVAVGSTADNLLPPEIALAQKNLEDLL